LCEHRRCGELLQEVEAANGTRTDLQPSAGADTRFGAAEEAGLSRRQAVTAIRVGNVPKDEFERQVESDDPPTVTALAEQGKRSAPAASGQPQPAIPARRSIAAASKIALCAGATARAASLSRSARTSNTSSRLRHGRLR
jgi:hypothetical protein